MRLVSVPVISKQNHQCLLLNNPHNFTFYLSQNFDFICFIKLGIFSSLSLAQYNLIFIQYHFVFICQSKNKSFTCIFCIVDEIVDLAHCLALWLHAPSKGTEFNGQIYNQLNVFLLCLVFLRPIAFCRL